MTLKLTTLCAALALTAAPASAQILGGSGGLGGALGGTLGGQIGGTLGNIGTATTGTLTGSNATRIDRDVDTHSGRARAHGKTSSSASGSLGSSVTAPLGSARASGQAGGSASGEAGIGVQAVGTDAVGGVVGSVTGTAQGAASGAVNRATALGNNVSASGQGTASGMANSAGGSLAAAGSAAANAAGAIAVSPGMTVRDTSGRAIGEIQGLRATANGVVDTVLVEVGNRVAALPADNFSLSGQTLVSAMSRADVRREARDQNDNR